MIVKMSDEVPAISGALPLELPTLVEHSTFYIPRVHPASTRTLIPVVHAHAPPLASCRYVLLISSRRDTHEQRPLRHLLQTEINHLHKTWCKCQAHAEAVATAAAANMSGEESSGSVGGANAATNGLVGDLLLPLRIATVADDGSVHIMNVSARKPPEPFSKVKAVKKPRKS